LANVILTHGSAGRFPRGLNRWEQEGDQYADDGDDDQELDQGETM
jgi:hypothetical protein